MISVESGIYAQDGGQAANHQSRSNQQDERKRDFNDHENGFGATSGDTRARPSFSQRRVMIEARSVECWNPPEENSGHYRSDNREQQHALVNPDLPGSRQQDIRQ